jgi:acetyl esterase/lipase
MPVLQATCEYKNINGCSIKTDVFLPSAQHPPVILYLHGGGLISGSRGYMLNYQTKLYQKAGFAVVAADYRLAPETKLPAILDDIKDAIYYPHLPQRDGM